MTTADPDDLQLQIEESKRRHPAFAPRRSDCPDLTTEDNRTPITEGQRLYNYYDCKWGTVHDIRADGWFTFRHDDGTTAILNGVRVSTQNPRGEQ